MSKTAFAADMKALDLLNLEGAVRALERQGIDEFHFDVADGRFVEVFGFAPAVIAAVKAVSSIPCHAHLLVAQPERVLPAVLASGADTVTLHLEKCVHIHRALSQIRDAGRQAGIAVLPATPLTKVNYLFPQIDRLLLLGSDPVRRGGGLPRAASERIRLLHENIRYHKYAVALEVEGAESAEDAARCIRFGASRVVVGPGAADGLADPERPAALRDFVERVSAAVHTV